MLHTALLPKLIVIKMYLIIMREYPLMFRGLRPYSLKIESLAQLVNHFVSLSISDTLS